MRRRLAHALLSVGVSGGLLACVLQPAHAQVYLPQKNGRAFMPDEWLLGEGRPFHYRVPAVGDGGTLHDRPPTAKEQAAIDAIRERFRRSDGKALLLGDANAVVEQQFKPPAREDSLLLSASIDKSLTAFSVGVAVCEGRLAMSTRVRDVLPELAGVDLGESTLRDALTMSSGTTPAFDDSDSFTTQDTADLLAGRRSLMDMLKARLGKARPFVRTGERFDYKAQDPLAAGMMVAAAYGLEGKGFRQWQAAHFFGLAGTRDRRVQGTDRFDYAHSHGSTRMTIRDWARLAAFIVERRRQPDCYGGFLREATTTQVRTDGRFGRAYRGYGYFTWTDNAEVPDSFSALGYGGQAIVWSTVNDRYFIVFGNAIAPGEIHAMARLWLSAD